jgi:hypothetical protein
VAGVLLALLVAIGLIGLLICAMGSEDHYATMSEEEFEEEAKKKSMLGAAITGMESALRRREAGYVMEAKKEDRARRYAVARRQENRLSQILALNREAPDPLLRQRVNRVTHRRCNYRKARLANSCRLFFARNNVNLDLWSVYNSRH